MIKLKIKTENQNQNEGDDDRSLGLWAKTLGYRKLLIGQRP